MAGIDLIPRQYALQRRLWRHCKWFAAAMLSLVCLVAAARGALWFGAVTEHRQLSDLRKNEQHSSDSLAKVRQFEEQKAAAQKELKALADLRGRDRVRMLVEALDQAWLNGIWLDEIRSFRAGNLPSVNGQAGSPSSAVPVANPQSAAAQATPPAAVQDQHRVELAGHAVEHSGLAAFMTLLAAQPAVSDVRLLDTSSNGSSTEPSIDFRMSLAITGLRQP
jgi:Tfp pilus assembly protein PilN